MKPQEEKATVTCQKEGQTLLIKLAGHWTMRRPLPDRRRFMGEIEGLLPLGSIRFDTTALKDFDSILVTFFLQILQWADDRQINPDLESLPSGLLQLVKLSRQGAASQPPPPPEAPGFFDRVGLIAIDIWKENVAMAEFVGDTTLSFYRLLTGKAKMRAREFWIVLEAASTRAFAIVALISFLVGVIISFLGAVTLKRFGAEFAVSYLVGYGMLREMGAIMTGIIMAGRTGAAFAAEIGSMKVNEEIDALKTLGISPIDYLVLPRLIALLLMIPVLTVFANIIGIFSGWLVAEYVMGVPGAVFFTEMNRVIGIGDFGLGIFKAGVFGLIIGVAGCLRGLQCGSGADAVGRAATSAVVTGITLIIFANAVIDWIAAALNI